MTNKFGAQVLGVHGAELPRFAGHPKDQFYWTMQKSYNAEPNCQSLNLYKQNVKYWAENDKVKLADTEGVEAPIDPFKTEYHQQKSKFNLAGKVNLENHWEYNKCIGDPEFKRKWEPEAHQCWSQVEKSLRCEGIDRPHRTMEKLVVHAKEADVADLEREKLTEEVLIRQAPRSLQTEVAQMIQTEKMIEASMQIGKGTRASASNNESQAQSKEERTRMQKDASGSGTQKQGEQKASQQGIADQEHTKKENNAMLATMYITAPGKGSLMQRMASPNQQTIKKGGPGSNFGNTLMTTMAGTKNAAEMSMNSSQGSMMNTQRFMATHHSSPFRDSIIRGMVTGVGLLGKK